MVGTCCAASDLESVMDEKSYKAMLTKPPDSLGEWPLILIVEFKEAVYEANLVLSRSRFAKGWRQTFAEKAERVCGFYRLQDEIEERRHHAD